MTAQYTIVQYVPDPVIGERINIGIIVVGEGRVYARFLDNWQRVNSFASENTAFLRDFAARIENAIATGESPQMPLVGMLIPRPLDAEYLAEMAHTWVNSIQFTPLRGSIKPPEALLDEISARFLRSAQRRPRRYRGRNEASQLVIGQVKRAVRSLVGETNSVLVRPHREVVGEVGFHKLDAVVENGRPLFAAHGLSFEGSEDGHELDRHAILYAGATEYAVLDIRERNDDLPIGVMIFPPNQRTLSYERTMHTLAKVGADVISEQDLPGWTIKMAERVLGSSYRDHLPILDR